MLDVIAPYMSAPSSTLRVATGDDASVWMPDGEVVITTDSLVEDVHFQIWNDVEFYVDLGWKLLAISLSDLAAMGAEPGPAFLALALPKTFAVSHVEALYQGLRECADRYGATLAGGNLTDASTVVLTSTCLGTVRDGAITRTGALPGWRLAVTGELGAAAAALRAINHPDHASEPPHRWMEKLRRPDPRIEAGLALRGRDVTAIDISDGAFIDAARLLGHASGLRIDGGSLPMAPRVREARHDDWLEVAGGGEDYELLFAAPPDAIDAAVAAVRATGTAATMIGEFDDGDGVRVVIDGAERKVATGYQHFR